MITTILIVSVVLNIVAGFVVYSLSKETTKQPLKIVYKDKIIEKVVYKDKIVEKIVYKDRAVHDFIKKEPKVSVQKQELLEALRELKSKKKKSKKDLENIYIIEKILPNLK